MVKKHAEVLGTVQPRNVSLTSEHAAVAERFLNYVSGDDVRLLKSHHCNAVCKGVDMRKGPLWSQGLANWIGFYLWSPFESQPGVLQVCVSHVFFSKDREYMKRKKKVYLFVYIVNVIPVCRKAITGGKCAMHPTLFDLHA